MKIGTFIKDNQGTMHGRIYGFGLGITSVVFDPHTNKEGKQYFKLIADPLKEGYEIGFAFPKEKNGTIYHSINIESPALPSPISAALFPDRERPATYNLVWSSAAEPDTES